MGDWKGGSFLRRFLVVLEVDIISSLKALSPVSKRSLLPFFFFSYLIGTLIVCAIWFSRL
jgi:hypothetical protein